MKTQYISENKRVLLIEKEIKNYQNKISYEINFGSLPFSYR